MATTNAGTSRRRQLCASMALALIAAIGCSDPELEGARGSVESLSRALGEDDGGVEDTSHNPTDTLDPADEHCAMDIPADPRDETLDPAPVVVRVGWFSRDILLPREIIEWMEERDLPRAHDAWHMTRRWDDQCSASFAAESGCDFARRLLADGLWRAELQQGAPGSGLAFLHMHRHMLETLALAFPQHAEIFRGFRQVPRSRDDAENPTPWRNIAWTRDNLVGFEILEHIEDHVDEFSDEDEFGVWLESNFRWTPEDPAVALGRAGAGVHGALHREWSVNRSPADLGGTDTALPNYVFWKLHGFIDDVWTRFRIAKGLHDDDPAYRAVARSECRLMYFLTPEHRAHRLITH